MIYASYGILNNFCLYDDMDDIEKNPAMLEEFKSIAYINVRKLPGYRTSNNGVIGSAYQQHKAILHKANSRL